jgi:hypothetical protein
VLLYFIYVRFPVLPDFLRSSGSGTGIFEELLEWKSSGSGLEIEINGHGDSLR